MHSTFVFVEESLKELVKDEFQSPCIDVVDVLKPLCFKMIDGKVDVSNYPFLKFWFHMILMSLSLLSLYVTTDSTLGKKLMNEIRHDTVMLIRTCFFKFAVTSSTYDASHARQRVEWVLNLFPSFEIPDCHV